MRTFAIFLLAYTLSQFYRSFLAVIAPELATELNLTAADLGNISAIWFAVFSIAQFPVGWALDAIGPRRTVPVMMLAAVLGAIGLAQAQSVTHCLIAMGLIGLGCSPIYMGALYVFARTEPAQRFALLASWMLGIGSSGNLLGATPLAWLAQTIGWRHAFLAIAVVTAFSAIIIAVLVRDPPKAEKSGLKRGPLQVIGDIISIRALWPIMPIALLSYSVIAAERGLWVGPFLDEVYSLDPIDRGNIVLGMAIAMSAGSIVYGPLDRVFGTRKWVALTGTLLTGSLFIALGSMPDAPITTAMLLLICIGFAAMTYGVVMAHARDLFPEHLVGRGITFVNFLFIGGTVLIQPLSGRFVEAQRSIGRPVAEIYSDLHFAFGVVLLSVAAIYLFSTEQKSGQPPAGRMD